MKILRAAIFFSFASTLLANAQQSQWVHPNAAGQLVYGHGKTGEMLPDYSYAGYHAGGVAPPDVPTQAKVTPSGADDTAAIQKAIDTVSARPLDANGFRGAVELSAGVFHASTTLTIRASGVVLRGAGSGPNGTILTLTGDPHLGIKVIGAWKEKEGSALTTLADNYVPFGAHTIHVADASRLHVGDLVRIDKPVTDAWVKFMGMDGLVRDAKAERWVSGKLPVRRRIAAIDGKAITFTIALMDSYDAALLGANSVTVTPVQVSGQLTEVGIEKLRIEAPARSISLEDPQFNAIDMHGAADAWVQQVTMIDTTQGIQIDSDCERITLTRTEMVNHKPITSAAKPFQLSIAGTQVLVDRATGSGDATFYFATQARQQGPVVLLNSHFTGDGHVQPHQRWSTGLLIDNCSETGGGGIDLMNRGQMGSGHGWTMGWGVIWNSTADEFTVEQAPGTFTWSIGNRGKQQSAPMPFLKGTPDMPKALIESPNKPVTPQSLYLAQLQQRLGAQALQNIGYSSADPAK